ncbi:MAG: hypothetical protein Q9166_007803 [cf. Caloplaca sp. 2 TL-2023]
MSSFQEQIERAETLDAILKELKGIVATSGHREELLDALDVAFSNNAKERSSFEAIKSEEQPLKAWEESLGKEKEDFEAKRRSWNLMLPIFERREKNYEDHATKVLEAEQRLRESDTALKTGDATLKEKNQQLIERERRLQQQESVIQHHHDQQKENTDRQKQATDALTAGLRKLEVAASHLDGLAAASSAASESTMKVAATPQDLRGLVNRPDRLIQDLEAGMEKLNVAAPHLDNLAETSATAKESNSRMAATTQELHGLVGQLNERIL